LASVLKNPPDEDGRKLRPAVWEIVVIFLLRPNVLRGEADAVGADAKSACTSFAVGLLSLSSAHRGP